jgi:exosome complex exonuclease RRP6
MDSPGQFQTLQDSLKSALLTTTRTTTQLCAEDLAFHRSLDPTIARTLDEHNARLLSLAERLLGSAAQSTDVVGPKLQDSDALEANWRGVVDVVDSLLERVDVTLDDLKGVVKRGVENGQEVCFGLTEEKMEVFEG